MACGTISPQLPWRSSVTKTSQEKLARLQQQKERRDASPHELCATLTCSRAIIRVSLERREHHGPREVTVVGCTVNQSSICSSFAGLLFSKQRPRADTVPNSFSKGTRPKAHVRAGSQLLSHEEMTFPSWLAGQSPEPPAPQLKSCTDEDEAAENLWLLRGL
jgi:hypothetical protein